MSTSAEMPSVKCSRRIMLMDRLRRWFYCPKEARYLKRAPEF
jgi:hypothetical protein